MRMRDLRSAMRNAGLGVLAAGGLAGADPVLGHSSCSACDPGCQTCNTCSSGSATRVIEPTEGGATAAG